MAPAAAAAVAAAVPVDSEQVRLTSDSDHKLGFGRPAERLCPNHIACIMCHNAGVSVFPVTIATTHRGA